MKEVDAKAKPTKYKKSHLGDKVFVHSGSHGYHLASIVLNAPRTTDDHGKILVLIEWDSTRSQAYVPLDSIDWITRNREINDVTPLELGERRRSLRGNENGNQRTRPVRARSAAPEFRSEGFIEKPKRKRRRKLSESNEPYAVGNEKDDEITKDGSTDRHLLSSRGYDNEGEYDENSNERLNNKNDNQMQNNQHEQVMGSGQSTDSAANDHVTLKSSNGLQIDTPFQGSDSVPLDTNSAKFIPKRSVSEMGKIVTEAASFDVVESGTAPPGSNNSNFENNIQESLARTIEDETLETKAEIMKRLGRPPGSGKHQKRKMELLRKNPTCQQGSTMKVPDLLENSLASINNQGLFEKESKQDKFTAVERKNSTIDECDGKNVTKLKTPLDTHLGDLRTISNSLDSVQNEGEASQIIESGNIGNARTIDKSARASTGKLSQPSSDVTKSDVPRYLTFVTKVNGNDKNFISTVPTVEPLSLPQNKPSAPTRQSSHQAITQGQHKSSLTEIVRAEDNHDSEDEVQISPTHPHNIQIAKTINESFENLKAFSQNRKQSQSNKLNRNQDNSFNSEIVHRRNNGFSRNQTTLNEHTAGSFNRPDGKLQDYRPDNKLESGHSSGCEKSKYFVSRKKHYSASMGFTISSFQGKRAVVEEYFDLPKAIRIPSKENLIYYYCGFSVFYGKCKNLNHLYQFGCCKISSDTGGIDCDIIYLTREDIELGLSTSNFLKVQSSDVPEEYLSLSLI